MNNEHWDELLEQGLSGDPPRAEFRDQVLRDSVGALARVRRTRARWRAATLAAAAVLIAGVSFMLGRYSLRTPLVERPGTVTPMATSVQGVTVPNDLVAWLDAARLFRQLGMEDRMARAVDHASKLLPYDTAVVGTVAGPAVAAGDESVDSRKNYAGLDAKARRPEPAESAKRILAQVLGD